MGHFELLIHLLNFAAPALAVAVLVASAARAAMARRPTGQSWWLSVAINSIAGWMVSAAGLWHFGADGKMATYAVLVLAVATTQWLLGRSWQR